MFSKCRARASRALTRPTGRDYWSIPILFKLPDPIGEVARGNMQRIQDVAFTVFSISANVEHNRILMIDEPCRIGRIHLLGSVYPSIDKGSYEQSKDDKEGYGKDPIINEELYQLLHLSPVARAASAVRSNRMCAANATTMVGIIH